MTAGAIGCQKAVAKRAVAARADDVLTVKPNQPNLLEQVSGYPDGLITAEPEVQVSENQAHSHKEVRRLGHNPIKKKNAKRVRQAAAVRRKPEPRIWGAVAWPEIVVRWPRPPDRPTDACRRSGQRGDFLAAKNTALPQSHCESVLLAQRGTEITS